MKYVLFYEKACNLVRWLKIFQLVLLEDIITPFSYSSLCATGHYCPLVKYRLIIDSWPKDTRHTAQRPDATRTKQLISDHNSYTKWTFSYETPFKYEQNVPSQEDKYTKLSTITTSLWKWVKSWTRLTRILDYTVSQIISKSLIFTTNRATTVK